MAYSESLPPQLSVSVTGGSWLVGRKGEVLVVPGVRVSVDCIYSKKRGTPEWSWSNTSKEYKTVAENDNYRLVLDNVVLEVIINYYLHYYNLACYQDSGDYVCTTQRG